MMEAPDYATRCPHTDCPWWIAAHDPGFAADRLILHLRRRHDGLPPTPAGATPISTDEAVHRLVTSDHSAAGRGSAEQDAALIDLLRAGSLTAAYNPDTRDLIFTRLR